MNSSERESFQIEELIALLQKDRAWILEKLDKGCWPELRVDLAALERELGQLLSLVEKQFLDNQ